MSNFVNTSTFINRDKEISYLKKWIEEEPNNILFIHGPKSSGKTTLLLKFINKELSKKKYDLKFFNLRDILINNYKDFLRVFFEIDYSKSKSDVKKKKEYNLKVFKQTIEVINGIEINEINPFVVMKKDIQTLVKKKKCPVIIIDEIQSLQNIYFNAQKELINELFNFFVALTKESHLCHVIIASSDGYFIEKIYKDSKLKKTSKFLLIDYLNKEDVFYWLSNLDKESKISDYSLNKQQIEKIFNTLGGSCWEIYDFLSDLRRIVNSSKIEEIEFDELILEKITRSCAVFDDYIGVIEKRKKFFIKLHRILQKNKNFFRERDFESMVKKGLLSPEELKDILCELVRENIISYNPTLAKYSLQGKIMEHGLNKYLKEINII